MSNSKNRLVLLPGLDGTGKLFEPICQRLADRFDTYVVSYPTDTPLSATQLAANIRRQIPNEQDYWLLGESFSGPLAVQLAAQEDHCRGLILSATFLSNPHPVLSTLFPVVRRLPITAGIRAQMVRTVLGKYRTDQLQTMLETVTQQVDDAVFHSRVELVIQTNANRAMQECHRRGVPVLSLTARNDWVVPGKASQAIRDFCPDCEELSFDAPHVLLQAAPDEAAIAIAKFVEKSSA